MSFFGLLVLDEGKDLVTIYVVATLVNNGIADFSDKDYKSGGCVVAGRVFPDQQDDVHGGYKQFMDLSEVLACVS